MQKLFGVDALVQGPGWRVWRPNDPPFPPAFDGQACRWDAGLHWELPTAAAWSHNTTTRTRRVPVEQAMCLATGVDYISDRIRARGFWRDCALHVRLWQALDGRVWPKRGPAAQPLPSADDPKGVLLEVGSNIGACTVELLLRTHAKIIAFEPNPANLFHLTHSLHRLAQRDATMANRVVVYPIGLGDARDEPAHVVTEVGNLGNSIVLESRPSSAAASAKPRAFASYPALNVSVDTLDALLARARAWPSP